MSAYHYDGTYHYDGSPCPESCACVNREVERLRAQLEAVTRERDEARADAAGLRQKLDDATAPCHGLGCGRCADCVSLARADAARLREAAEFGQKVAEERGVLQGLVYWRKKAVEWRGALAEETR